MNGWAQWAVGFLALLIIGSYTYTWVTRAEIQTRLERIENKLDCALKLPYCGR